MKELKINLFDAIFEDGIDAICIPTDGNYSKNNIAIMNNGYAEICSQRWKQTAKRLGKYLKVLGTNTPFVIGALDKGANYLEPSRELIRKQEFKCLIFNFPIMNNFIMGANLALIRQSATILVDYANQYNLFNLVFPVIDEKNLKWESIKPEIEAILDDRFLVAIGI